MVNKLTISVTRSLLDNEKAIALGGVATGNIKAKLAVKAVGSMYKRGLVSCFSLYQENTINVMVLVV